MLQPLLVPPGTTLGTRSAGATVATKLNTATLRERSHGRGLYSA